MGQPCSVELVVVCPAGLRYLADHHHSLTVSRFLAPELQSMLPKAPLRVNAAQIISLQRRARWAKGSSALHLRLPDWSSCCCSSQACGLDHLCDETPALSHSCHSACNWSVACGCGAHGSPTVRQNNQDTPHLFIAVMHHTSYPKRKTL